MVALYREDRLSKSFEKIPEYKLVHNEREKVDIRIKHTHEIRRIIHSTGTQFQITPRKQTIYSISRAEAKRVTVPAGKNQNEYTALFEKLEEIEKSSGNVVAILK